MKLIRPSKTRLPRWKEPSRELGTRAPDARPKWLQQYIADKGEFVELSCGHRTNLNDRALLVVAKISGTYVVCERCNDLALVTRHMKFREYANIPEPTPSEVPLF